jgi:hypothetical protein
MNALQHSLLISSLLASASLVASEPATPPPAKQPLMPAYTAPVDIRVNRSWDAYFVTNYLYWEALQDNMELGIVSPPTNSTVSIDGDVINNNVQFSSGFQVGLGFGTNYDGWNTELLYTWLQNSHSTSKTLDSSSGEIIFPLWISPQILVPPATFTSEKWELNLNVLDWTLGRSSLIGRRLTLYPFFGLRSAWIDQSAHVHYKDPTSPPGTFYNGTSHSWSIGPEVGLFSDWLLGAGVKLYGSAEGDLLYTRYTSLNTTEGRKLADGSTQVRRAVSQHNVNAVRPHCDLEFGVSWGDYFCSNNFHLDMALGYGFQVFWDQNMFRHFGDDLAKGSSQSPNGNLYIQGLTASMRFDF